MAGGETSSYRPLATSPTEEPYKEPKSSPSQSSSIADSPITAAFYRTARRFAVPLITLGVGIIFLLSILTPSTPANARPRLWRTRVGKRIPGPLPTGLQDSHTLSAKQCQLEFPLFYPQFEANEKKWRKQGGIKHHHVQDASAACIGGRGHVVISGGQIFIRDLVHDWQSRTRAVLHLLALAVQGADEEDRQALEGVEFVFSNADKDGYVGFGGDGAGWVLDKRVMDPAGQYLIPDFSFAAWPEAGVASYGEFRRDAATTNAAWPWSKKHQKFFWRGDPNVGSPARSSLVKKVAEPGSDRYMDVKRTSFWETGPGISPIVTPAEHCEHRYLLHSEGNAYSGRSKFILGCSSAVIVHQFDWTQHFHPALISNPSSSDQNVIQSPGSWFDELDSLAARLFDADEQAASSPSWIGRRLSEGEKVALNANRTLSGRYLTPAATSCYFRAALLSYASVMDRKSWPGGKGPQVRLGGGVKPGAGAANKDLKTMDLKGDIEWSTWELLKGPEWPVKRN